MEVVNILDSTLHHVNFVHLSFLGHRRKHSSQTSVLPLLELLLVGFPVFSLHPPASRHSPGLLQAAFFYSQHGVCFLSAFCCGLSKVEASCEEWQLLPGLLWRFATDGVWVLRADWSPCHRSPAPLCDVTDTIPRGNDSCKEMGSSWEFVVSIDFLFYQEMKTKSIGPR